MTGRTIVYLPNWLGDMVMAVPFLFSIRMGTKEEIWFCGKSKAIHLYNGLNLFDRFLPIEGKNVTDFYEAVTFLRKKNFKNGVILPHSFRAALLFFVGKVKERIGYEKNLRGILLSKKLKLKDEVEPTVEHYLRIADYLKIDRVTDTPILAVTEDEEMSFFESHDDIKPPYGVFTVGARYGPSKCWPEEYYAKLADMITKGLGLKIYILPDKDEEQKAKRIKDLCQYKENVEIRYLNLRDLKVCISQASFLVSNDTGPRHIGSALGIPTLVLLGPMDERYTRYPSSSTFVFNARVPCSPCNKRVCDRGHECMKKIQSEVVFEKIMEILNYGKPSWNSRAI
ncbi:MAG: glycosyltransferase family 9 protein [Deltaproteobacteria bacterium]|nr:glycosyltransferase family 9 protein [Deltaproteobacteria bacterium]